MLCLVTRQTVYYALGLLLHDEKYLKFIWLILKIDKRKKEKRKKEKQSWTFVVSS